MSSLAPSAFLASAAGKRGLQVMIMAKCDASVDSAVDSASVQWSIAHGQAGTLPPVDSASTKQQEWDEPSTTNNAARLDASLSGRHYHTEVCVVDRSKYDGITMGAFC